MPQPIVDAAVRLHGRHVGTLRYQQGGSTFRYEDDLRSASHLTLGQIFEDDPRKVWKNRVGLPDWFANLLPEGELRKQVVRELGGGFVGDFTLLLRLGSSLPGAVTVHGEQEPDDDDPAEVDSASESADHALRHSLAGVQLKYAVPGDSLTFPASGEGAWWIAKLPRPGLPDLLLNEYLTMRWLAAAGMNVPSVQLVPASAVGGIPAGMAGPQDPIYLIKRFDRSVSGRIHIEDFAQVAEVAPAFKYSRSGATYDSLGGAVLRLLGEAGYYEYVGRLTAMIITGNTDAHLKNWSLIYPDGKTPELSPLYDFQSLTLYTRYRYAPLALSLGAEDPSLPSLVVELDNFHVLAENAGAAADETVRVVQDTAERLRAAWSGELKAEADSRFPALSRHFAERLASLPICSA